MYENEILYDSICSAFLDEKLVFILSMNTNPKYHILFPISVIIDYFLMIIKQPVHKSQYIENRMKST